MSGSTILGLVGSVLILVTLFEMLRRQRLREKYALFWSLIAVAALVLALFPGLLAGLTDALGVALPVNLAFFVGGLLLFLVSLQHSADLGRLEERTRTLAEEVAVLRLELDRLRRRPTGGSTDSPTDSPADSPEGHE